MARILGFLAALAAAFLVLTAVLTMPVHPSWSLVYLMAAAIAVFAVGAVLASGR